MCNWKKVSLYRARRELPSEV